MLNRAISLPSGAPADPRCGALRLRDHGYHRHGARNRARFARKPMSDVPAIVREVLEDIGYNRAKYGFDATTCGVLNAIHDGRPC